MLKKCSEKDIAQMSEVLRQRRRVHASGYALRAEDIAEHLANATEDEERAIQRKLNLEAFTKNSPGGILTPASSDVEMQPAATGKLEEEYDQNQPLIYQRIRRHS
jgi:hypothetical protein